MNTTTILDAVSFHNAPVITGPGLFQCPSVDPKFRFNLLCSSCGCSRRVDSDGNTALILAARVGNRAAVQAAMCTAQQCNPAHCAALVDAQNFRGQTALMVACLLGASGVDCALELLSGWGANPNIPDVDGKTPLHTACAAGNEETVVALLQAGAFINAQDDDGDTPLHSCLGDGHRNIARILISKGACLSLRNDEGDSGLDLANEALPGNYGVMINVNTPVVQL